MNWLKAAPYIVGVFLIIGLIAWSKSKLDEAWHIGYRTAMNEVRIERDTERALYEHKREVAERDYQSKVSELETRVDHLLARPPVVRVCKPAADQMRVPEAGARPHAAADAGPAVQAGADIGGDLVLYGRDCEATRRQLTALQGWLKSLD
jgi:hypothetical protein